MVRPQEGTAIVSDAPPIATVRPSVPASTVPRAQSLGVLEDSRPWLLAGIGGFVAGAIHFAITPDHFAEAAGQGLFFLTLGTVQIGWALWLLARPSIRAWFTGLAIACASVLVYVLSLFVPAPFASTVETIDYLAIFTKLVELATIGILAIPVVKLAPALGRPRGKMATTVLVALALGVAGAGASYGIGYGLEMIAPGLSDPSEHHHGEGEMHSTSSSGFAAGLSAPTGRVSATSPQTVP